MDPLIGASIISTLGSLMGGGMGMAFGGGGVEGLDRSEQRFIADKNLKYADNAEALTNELARHGIRMRVDDAVSAGLHPLVGAGINPAQGGSSASVGGSPHQGRSRDFGFIDRMGQDISRAWSATATKDEKLMKAAELMRVQADIEESHARAVLARKQAAELGRTPPMPIPSKYMQVRNEHGDLETIMNPDIAGGYISDPLGLWANSFRKAFGGPDTMGLRSRGHNNPYAPGGVIYNMQQGGKK